MISLEKYSGLPIAMRDDYSLEFADQVSSAPPLTAEFPSIKNYLKNPLSTYWRRDVYHIYRDVAVAKHKDKILQAGLSYNLTVIPPGLIGDEFVKTRGHYHTAKEAAAIRYPEIYEVIYGKAFFVLQSASDDLERLKEIYLLEALRGEKVVVPPGFGHVCVNPADDVLVVANWKSLKCGEIHEPYEAKNGAAYYVTESEILGVKGKTVKESEFVPNLSYSFLPKLKVAALRQLPKYDLVSAIPMYFSAIRNMDTLDFLKNPENYLEEITSEKLFKLV
ncbi:MAG: glucose-6-phosphate isomerase family protein [bacterium]|nr:glucose-6-phosphate isomerase family protein [bacterium]